MSRFLLVQKRRLCDFTVDGKSASDHHIALSGQQWRLRTPQYLTGRRPDWCCQCQQEPNKQELSHHLWHFPLLQMGRAIQIKLGQTGPNETFNISDGRTLSQSQN